MNARARSRSRQRFCRSTSAPTKSSNPTGVPLRACRQDHGRRRQARGEHGRPRKRPAHRDVRDLVHGIVWARRRVHPGRRRRTLCEARLGQLPIRTEVGFRRLPLSSPTEDVCPRSIPGLSHRALIAIVVLFFAVPALHAQWLNYKIPGSPAHARWQGGSRRASAANCRWQARSVRHLEFEPRDISPISLAT